MKCEDCGKPAQVIKFESYVDEYYYYHEEGAYTESELLRAKPQIVDVHYFCCECIGYPEPPKKTEPVETGVTND